MNNLITDNPIMARLMVWTVFVVASDMAIVKISRSFYWVRCMPTIDMFFGILAFGAFMTAVWAYTHIHKA